MVKGAAGEDGCRRNRGAGDGKREAARRVFPRCANGCRSGACCTLERILREAEEMFFVILFRSALARRSDILV